MICYNCPDFYYGYRIYAYLGELKITYPEVFFENTKISSVFGCFPNAIWNGGTILLAGKTFNKTEIMDMFKLYNEALELPIRLTFTNPLITKEQCYDTYCNLIAECGHNGKNEILVVSPVLEQYLREKYPNYTYIRSIVSEENTDVIGSPDYGMVVINRRYNNNWEYLDKIPMEFRDKVEFLCNDVCPDNCPRIYTHYKDLARAQLSYDDTNPNTFCSMDHIKGRFQHKFARTQKGYITRDMILNDYVPKGFTQFKLSGRTDLGIIIPFLIEHLIKPEYRLDVLADMIEISVLSG